MGTYTDTPRPSTSLTELQSLTIMHLLLTECPICGQCERDMTTCIPRYYEHLNFEELWKEFPTADEYVEGVFRKSADELRNLQNDRFNKQVARAWEIPFYQRHWGNAGLAKGDVQG